MSNTRKTPSKYQQDVLFCEIEVSYHPDMSSLKNFIDPDLYEAHIVALPSFYSYNRTGRRITISGFRSQDEVVMWPLWSKDGYQQYRFTVREYNAAIHTAKVTISHYETIPAPADFDETVKNLDCTIRDTLKYATIFSIANA
jgi:hypothetical protein